MLTSKSQGIIFSNNSILSKMNNNQNFQGIMNAISPRRNKLATPVLDELAAGNKPSSAKTDLKEIALQSHYKNRMCGEYPFLQLTPENQETYILAFAAGCMHVTQQNIEKLKSGTVLDENNHEAIN